MVTYIFTIILAYLIGSVNFSVMISKKMAGFDIREKGSGNAGTANMLRSVGKKAAVVTLLCDILKGVVAILIAIIVSTFVKNIDKALLVQLSGIAVTIGHTLPIFFQFKGGKGVATFYGVLLMINWKIGLICLIFAVTVIVLTKMSSLSSIGSAILCPVLVLFIHTNYTVPEGTNYLIFSILLAILIMFNHRSNIKRLLAGKENKISFKDSK